MSDSLQPYGLQAASLLSPWDSPAKNTGVGCHALLQGIFQWGIKGSNPCLKSPALADRFLTTSTAILLTGNRARAKTHTSLTEQRMVNESPPPTFVNRVLLAHSHTSLHVIYLWLLLHHKAILGS